MGALMFSVSSQSDDLLGANSSPNDFRLKKRSSSEWQEPAALLEGLLPVPPLVEAMIPSPLRGWLGDIAERIQCPLEFPAVGAIVALASLAGRRAGVRPKRYDDWLVILNLWGAVIGRPGIMKSPALNEIMRLLQRLELLAREQYQEACKDFEFDKLIGKARKEDLERRIRDAVKKGNDRETIMGSFSLLPEEEEPKLVRYVVNDATVEKLGELLNQNPNGLLLFRDELTGWLKTLDRDGHENDRAFYLESWNGSGAYTYDRIGRGTLYISAACLSILGGIQPGPLADYLRAAVRGGSGDDGLVQRLQLIVYPDDSQHWRNVDRWPDTKAKNRAFTLFEKLSSLAPLRIGAQIADDEGIPFSRFAPEGQVFFDGWRSNLEQKIRALDEHPAIESHLAKYRSLMPSLALLFHLLEVLDGTVSGPISLDAAHLAAAWCDFLEAHARRIYQSVTQHSLFAARRLAEHIKGGVLSNPFTPREVLHKGWSGLSSTEEIKDAVEVLEDLHWLRSEQLRPGEKGGRPRLQYSINPDLLKESSAR